MLPLAPNHQHNAPLSSKSPTQCSPQLLSYSLWLLSWSPQACKEKWQKNEKISIYPPIFRSAPIGLHLHGEFHTFLGFIRTFYTFFALMNDLLVFSLQFCHFVMRLSTVFHTPFLSIMTSMFFVVELTIFREKFAEKIIGLKKPPLFTNLTFIRCFLLGSLFALRYWDSWPSKN